MSLRNKALAAAGTLGLALSAATAMATTTWAAPAPGTTYAAVSGYQFAVNVGQPAAGGGPRQISSAPLSYPEASQALAIDGVDLKADPDPGTTWADSGVIVPL